MVGAGVVDEVVEGLESAVGEVGVDGELVFIAVVDRAQVEQGQEPFDQCVRGRW